jgi:hypothetical protein
MTGRPTILSVIFHSGGKIHSPFVILRLNQGIHLLSVILRLDREFQVRNMEG